MSEPGRDGPFPVARADGGPPPASPALEAGFGVADPEAHLVRNYRRLPTAFVRGRGCTLEEAGGRPVLDFAAGIAVSSLGHGIRPDAVALAKGLGGGVPVGALVARDDVAEHLEPGDHASTFGGNPLASRAAATVLRTIEDERLCRRAGERGRQLRRGLERVARATGAVTEVRGRGLLVAADLDRDAGEVTRRCLELGLLVNAVGPRTLRLTPPLVVSAEEVDRAVELLRRALTGPGPCSGPGGVGGSRSSRRA